MLYIHILHRQICVCLFPQYLTRELIWHSQSSSKIVYLLFENVLTWKRAIVSILMLSAKQGNYWYQVFGMTRPLSGIKHWTSRTRSEHSTSRLLRQFCIQLKNASLSEYLIISFNWYTYFGLRFLKKKLVLESFRCIYILLKFIGMYRTKFTKCFKEQTQI